MCLKLLLYSLIAVGSWNVINMIGRFYYKEDPLKFAWSVVLGIWAVVVLFI